MSAKFTSVTVGLTSKQKKAIEKATKKSGLLSVSAWCRKVILTKSDFLNELDKRDGVKH